MRRTVEELQARLDEAEELLRAIRSGEVDARVVSGAQGDQIYTLKGAEHPYRVMIETMSEGALILAADCTIVYSNQSFAAMLDVPLEQVIGLTLDHFVLAEDLPQYEALLRERGTAASKGEIRITSAAGGAVPVHLSISPFGPDEPGGICIVVIDLTEQKRHQELLNAEVRRRSEADLTEAQRIGHVGSWEWNITRVENALQEAIRGNTRFEVAYRIVRPDGSIRHHRGLGHPSISETGDPTFVGTVVDLTDLREAEQALRASEERFRRYFDLGLIGMAITSPSKGYIEVNDEMCRMLGYEREELLRMTWAEMTHPDDLASDVAQFDRVISREINGYSIDKRWIRKDGRTIYSIMSAQCMRRSDGSVDYFVGLVQDITERKTEEDVREELRLRLIEAQEEERRRIALDLHDQFGQQLSAITLALSALRRESGRRARLNRQLVSLEAIATELDHDLELIVSRLRPAALDDLGLVATLTDYVKHWSAHFGIRAELHATGEPGHLHDDVDIALYRIAQEALNNIAKHARAKHAAIIVDHHANRASLIIEDDGVGFNVEQSLRSVKRFGIVGMRERATLLRGTLDIESGPGRGTTVVARIPRPATPKVNAT